MCGAVSGFHALVASGTTPKMVSKESDIRTIGYAAMLMEGLVAVTALIAAATLPQGDYWAINIDLTQVDKYADTLANMNASVDHLGEIERQVGGETLRGRTGGAVTLAVGMAHIMTQAMQKFTGAVSLDGVVKYWYHFAIMFEALSYLPQSIPGPALRVSCPRNHGPFLQAFWRGRLDARCTHQQPACFGRLGWFDLERIDSNDLADVRNRQSIVGRHRAQCRHDLVGSERAPSLCMVTIAPMLFVLTTT